MNYLIIDGNSLINRAFYGIKLLTAKDGHYTNAIFGFMNMFLSLIEKTSPSGIAVAFDLKQPTFRHQMYDGYKAGRKGMPPELHEQMEPLKEILRAYGCHIVECPGYEADDILGTISSHTPEGDVCFIATGDRDSLQLIRNNVHVLLTTTKMGQTHTTDYDEKTLMEEYSLTPKEMIELKALQGDSSDNIPGVAGVGPKTAGELIKKYKDIDYIYDHLEDLEVTKGVREKLKTGKDNAFLSRTLGTIDLNAPIEQNIGAYLLKERDDEKLKAELAKHEMFKLIARLALSDSTPVKKSSIRESAELSEKIVQCVKPCELSGAINGDNPLYIAFFSEEELIFLNGNTVYVVRGEAAELQAAAKNIFENEENKIISFDAKSLYKTTLQNGIEIKNLIFDITLASYLLNPNASAYGISEIALTYNVPVPEIPLEGYEISENEGKIIKEAALSDVLTLRLKSILTDNDQLSLLTEMEIPLAEVLCAMETEGMEVNKKSIEDYSVVLSAKIDELQQEIYRLAGEEFNINSPKQLGVILFEKLNLPGKKKTKSGYSTNAEVLEDLRYDYPVVDKVLEYRTYSKLKNTYCDGLLKAIAGDGRIHSTFNQTETRTGRLSSTEPNLQNIPVRTELGREFRKFFTARDGYMIVDADYSQIELRVLAALSDDQNMIDSFNHNIDVHTVTAAKVFGVPEDEVTPELRSKAKAVNFGIVYGIGAFSLAKDIHSTRAEADRFIKAYLSLYSAIDQYMKDSIRSAKEKGYAITYFKRRRYLPELSSSNAALRAFGERVARNMPIQGTAADIIKIAMIKVYKRMKEEMPEAKLIMQVHDELMIEAPVLLAQKAARILKEEMENAVKLKVLLSVEVGIGKTWYEAKG